MLTPVIYRWGYLYFSLIINIFLNCIFYYRSLNSIYIISIYFFMKNKNFYKTCYLLSASIFAISSMDAPEISETDKAPEAASS